MMQWLGLLAIALGLIVLGRYLRPIDEVFSLALCITGILTGIWGLATAPSLVLLVFGLGAISWLQLKLPQA